MTAKPVRDSISTFVSMKPDKFFFPRDAGTFLSHFCFEKNPPDISSHIDTIFM